jgi:hypothetical protein
MRPFEKWLRREPFFGVNTIILKNKYLYEENEIKED